jgi:hypothetical protein
MRARKPSLPEHIGIIIGLGDYCLPLQMDGLGLIFIILIAGDRGSCFLGLLSQQPLRTAEIQWVKGRDVTE